MNKVFKNAEEAIFDLKNNTTIMLGGFGLCGIPENLISELVKRGNTLNLRRRTATSINYLTYLIAF